jgi:hypothetical protein
MRHHPRRILCKQANMQGQAEADYHCVKIGCDAVATCLFQRAVLTATGTHKAGVAWR